MSLVNSRIDFSAGTGGTLSGTSPVYVAYNGTNSYSTRTGTTARAIPTATKTGYTFNGWYTAATGGSQVVDASGNRKASVSSWTNASSQWVRTTTNDNATNNTLYAQYTAKTYTVTLDRNCSTTATGSTSTTATYDATTLAAITVPTCSNSTSTRTISGWTVPSGNNADGATVNGGTAPGTLNSTSTTTYTFNGWHATSGTGTLVASTAATPALQASTDYTDANKKWTYDDNATLYAGWTANAGAYNSVTLPTITKTGYTCGWTTTSTGATTIQYASGGSITPSANTTLYGVCVIKNNLSLKVSFNSTYVSSIKVCKTSGNCSGTNLMGTVSTSGNSVSGLTYGVAYYLYPTYTTGSVLNSWAKDSGAVGTLSSTSAANPTYTIGDGTNAVTHNGKRATYTVTLNQCSATTNGSTSATATYYSTTLSSITNPQRAYTVSGFTKTTSASGATVSSTTTLTSTYTFGGWVDGSCSGSTLVASNATTPTLQASVSGYTDSSKRWTRTSATTLYAKWTAQAKTLPTISWAGYTCRWQDANNTSTYYNSGASVTPTANLTLQGVCEAIDYTVTLRTGSGLSAIAPSGWTNAGNGTFTKVFHVGDTIDLSTVSTTLKTNYTGTKYTINNGIGSLSGSTYTVGAGNGDITISAASIDPIPECTMQGGTTIVYNQQDTVLTATDVSSNYDTTNMNITYQFGYGSSATAALGNFTTGQTGNTYTVTKAMYRGTRYYGVKITVADKNDSSITATCTSGTGSNTGTNVANRTTMVIVNSRINFNPKTYNKNITGTLSGTSPLYVSYLGTDVYTGRTNATVGTIPTATPPTGYSAFDGWYTSGNAKVINADGTLTGVAVSGWTNASSQWVKTGTSTSSSSTANTLYAHYIPNAYTITLNKNGATNTPTASTTATYDATTLGAIATLPTKTGYTISGFTSPAGNNASGATVSSTTTMTATNTFNGWHQGSGTGTLIASNAATPALQASTDYTDSSKKWTYDGAVTLYAGWTTQSKTLPTITKTGHTCGWTETATGATTIQYESGSSLTPSANKTLYGVCIANSYNYTINYNTAEINDVSIYDDEDYVYEGITNGQVVSLTYGQYYGIDISAKGGYGISSIVSSPDTDSLSNISYSTNYVGADADIEVKPRNNTITISATPQTYIYLNKNGATNSPTISTRAIYNATALERINTLPTRSYTVSGFTLPASNNTSGAVVSSTSTLTVNYTFKGWYKEAAATNKIAGTTNTPALEASTTYTDANGKWTYTAANSVTLYAGWTASATILPTITKTGGFTCGWTTTPTNATSFEYASGGSLMPTANTTLYGVCKCPANKICYDANPVNWNGAIVSDEVTGTMGGQTISSSDTSATLMASNYSRVDENDWGYGFAGWSTKSLTPDTVENDKGAPILNIPSDTQVYGPNETISFAAGTYNSTGLTLYATWLYGDDVFHLDDWAEYNMCTRLNIGDVTAVTDYRDEAQVYAIAKLADGKCWMIENLRLDNTGRNNSTGTFAQGYASGFVGLANPETANFTNSTTANSLYSTSNITGSNQGYRFPRYNNNNTAARASNPTSNETALYSYGNYYTWPAAVADTGNYTTNNQTISSTSICPAGWHLPSGGDKNNFANNEFWKLSRAIVGADPANYNAGLTPYYTGATEGVNASNALRRFPNNFVYSGYYDINSASHYGLFGAYVSSTVTNSTQNYGLDLGADYLNPGDHKVGYKNSGFNVRCVFEPTYKIVYNGNGSDSGYSMQATNTNLREGHSVRLYASNFKRDGYGFAGWSTTQINPDAPNAATLMENAKIFGPQEGFTLSQDETAVASSDGTITMYAVWVKPTGNLQSWTGCSSLASGKVIALRDTRDNNAYAVAKLADGKCWMIENLRLDNTATNNTSGSGAQAYGGQFAGLANPESPWGQISTANSLYYSGTQSGTATINIGTTNPTYRFPRYNNSNTSTGGSGPSTKDDKGAVYLYGNYYTWPAAIANTTNYLTAGNYNTTSICPKGWRIPTGKGNGEFGILSNSLGGLKNSSNVAQPMNSSTTPTGATMVLRLLKFPNNFTLSGSINDAAYVNQGAWGSYWTSTVENVSAIDLFYIDGVTVYPGQGGFWGKWAAATVRCMIGS
ncbi:InlB B-repeat-containing protein [Candidatus Saccharibacteria bacterium]|nr:InlB B-repeat-containing protein [Candidatus Saccharibacteria bacterium]